jgi:hypothetical protein
MNWCVLRIKDIETCLHGIGDKHIGTTIGF